LSYLHIRLNLREKTKKEEAHYAQLAPVAELVPQDLRYQLFHDTDMESRFVDAMEGREHEAITPFD
jgi:hypothetical protein